MSKSKGSKTNTIIIPRGSFVMMCGAPNSGKTTFAQKHFKDQKDTDVFCSDDLFMKAVKNSSIFDTFENLEYQTKLQLTQGILEGAKKGNTVVLDSVSYKPNFRKINAATFRKYFKHIVLIVIDLDIKDLLSHGTKPIIPEKIKFNLYPPNSEQCIHIATDMKNQILNGDINDGIDTVHIITSDTINNTKIVIE